MDDRNIVRAVLFSAALDLTWKKILLIRELKGFKEATSCKDSDDCIEAHADNLIRECVRLASEMVDQFVDAADIHDEDCPCSHDEEDEEETESNDSELSLEDIGEFLRAAARGALKAQLGGICRACGEAVKGKDKMVAHLATCGAIKNKQKEK